MDLTVGIVDAQPVKMPVAPEERGADPLELKEIADDIHAEVSRDAKRREGHRPRSCRDAVSDHDG